MVKTSQGIKKALRAILADIEKDPNAFDEMEDVPSQIKQVGNLVAIRKAKVTTQNHDFRIIFAHWRFEDGREHVDLLLAFPRKDGYEIDWQWVIDSLAE
jgi:hypothetical protein